MRALTIVLTKQVVLTEKTSSNRKKRTRTTFVITYHPALSNLSSIVREHWTTIQKHPELCKIFKEPPALAFRKPKSLKDILVRADISPQSAYNAQCQKCEFETMYDVQKHPMHTQIQQHTYRRKNHHILQCQLQDRKYYLPPEMCNLWSSIHRRN